MSWKILLPEDMRPEGKNFLSNQGHRLVLGKGTDTLRLMKDIKDADAVITRSAVISQEVIHAGKNLKAIACLGVGYDLVDLAAAEEAGIIVINCPDANSIAMTEITVFFMLYCSRRYTAVRRDYIDDYENAGRGDDKEELWDKTLGIVGCGRVGSRVAKICMDSFHMKVMAYDPYLPADAFPTGVQVIRKLPDLLAGSDFVSLHLSPHKGVRDQFRMEQFRQMKNTAYLINTAYAGAVSEKDLFEACRDGVIAGAALDGVSKLPLDKQNPILYMDNILISPRIGTATREAQTRTALQAAMGLQEIYEGKKPTWEVKSENENDYVIYHDQRKTERSR